MYILGFTAASHENLIFLNPAKDILNLVAVTATPSLSPLAHRP